MGIVIPAFITARVPLVNVRAYPLSTKARAKNIIDAESENTASGAELNCDDVILNARVGANKAIRCKRHGHYAHFTR